MKSDSYCWPFIILSIKPNNNKQGQNEKQLLNGCSITGWSWTGWVGCKLSSIVGHGGMCGGILHLYLEGFSYPQNPSIAPQLLSWVELWVQFLYLLVTPPVHYQCFVYFLVNVPFFQFILRFQSRWLSIHGPLSTISNDLINDQSRPSWADRISKRVSSRVTGNKLTGYLSKYPPG